MYIKDLTWKVTKCDFRIKMVNLGVALQSLIVKKEIVYGYIQWEK